MRCEDCGAPVVHSASYTSWDGMTVYVYACRRGHETEQLAPESEQG